MERIAVMVAHGLLGLVPPVPELLGALGEADVAVGSRYVAGVRVLDWPMRRLLLSFAANVYATRITGLRLHDATGGFNAYRRAVLEALDLESKISRRIVLEALVRVWGFRLRRWFRGGRA